MPFVCSLFALYRRCVIVMIIFLINIITSILELLLGHSIIYAFFIFVKAFLGPILHFGRTIPILLTIKCATHITLDLNYDPLL